MSEIAFHVRGIFFPQATSYALDQNDIARGQYLTICANLFCNTSFIWDSGLYSLRPYFSTNFTFKASIIKNKILLNKFESIFNPGREV